MSNKELVYKLVKNHFALSEESLKVFKDRLDNPVYDDIYKNFGLDKNHRKYWKIDGEGVDEGWKFFKNRYPVFCDTYNMSFEDFRDNKITDERKNRVKLLKALSKFYAENGENGGGHDINSFAGKYQYFLDNLEVKENLIFDDYSTPLIRAIFSYCVENKVIYYVFSDSEAREPVFNKELFTKEFYAKFLEDRVLKSDMEFIGRMKLSSKDLYLVLSLNFEDWLFCSTGDNWTSCLNLDSSYMYWSGLPGLITDPNRAMLYITDGEKKYPFRNIRKDCYNEIELDRFISRVWLHLGEDGTLYISNHYPSRMINNESISNIIGYEKVREAYSANGNVYTKNPFRLLYHVNEKSTSIYYDRMSLSKYSGNESVGDGKLTLSKKEGMEETLFRCRIGSSGGTCFYTISDDIISFGEDSVFNADGTMSFLIKEGLSLERSLLGDNIAYCEDCEALIDLDRSTYYSYGDGCICEHCYSDNYITCSDCGDVEPFESALYNEITEEYYCNYCYDKNFFYCEECNTDIPLSDESVTLSTGETICYNCFESNYVTCEKCGDNEVLMCEAEEINGKTYCSGCADEVEEEDEVKEEGEQLELFPVA